ncbi:unnamed protein product [Amoebophrya sp. A120]|nr:unnamed protein product [Amoebophrya sp. A120]|eukprot:GSA120T00011364001.1
MTSARAVPVWLVNCTAGIHNTDYSDNSIFCNFFSSRSPPLLLEINPRKNFHHPNEHGRLSCVTLSPPRARSSVASALRFHIFAFQARQEYEYPPCHSCILPFRNFSSILFI